jgi:hypothetical protein
MEDINYTIKFTDNTVENKNDIKIAPNVVNKTTDLLLHGRGSPRFGEDLWGNFIRLLENFCSNNVKPSNPTEGQLWFNASTKELLVYTRKGINDYVWNKILIDGVPNEYMKESDILEILKGYVLKVGDEMSGALILPSELSGGVPKITDDSNKFDAVTRTYVDYFIDIINSKLNDTTGGGTSVDYIVRNDKATDIERTMLKPLIIPSEFTNDTDKILKDGQSDAINNNNAVTKRYVDLKINTDLNTVPKFPEPFVKNGVLKVLNDIDKTMEWSDGYLELVGGIMEGDLFLADNDYTEATKTYSSTSLKIAASRQYVQDYLEKNKFSLPLGDNGKFLKKNDTSGELEWSKLPDPVVSIGVGQTWQNVTSSRAKDTVYTNDTGKPIMVMIYCNQGPKIFVDDVYIGFNAGASQDSGTITFIVPNSSTYKATECNPISNWAELR